jgi:hypothetical protein
MLNRKRPKQSLTAHWMLFEKAVKSNRNAIQTFSLSNTKPTNISKYNVEELNLCKNKFGRQSQNYLKHQNSIKSTLTVKT